MTGQKNGVNEEEWKSAYEPMKILGRVKTREDVEEEMAKVLKGLPTYIIPIDTQTTRVPVQHGHLEYLGIEFANPVDAEEIKVHLKDYQLPKEVATLPTTPNPLFVVKDEMPEPLYDILPGDGMAVVVGDVKQHNPHKISLFTLTHNLRRGATWAGRQGLELYLHKYEGFFKQSG